MFIETILTELKRERAQLDRAIAALEGTRSSPRGRKKAKTSASRRAGRKRRGGITAAGRKRLSEMMKKRWAERKAKARTTGSRHMSAAVRRRLSELMKARWAERRRKARKAA